MTTKQEQKRIEFIRNWQLTEANRLRGLVQLFRSSCPEFGEIATEYADRLEEAAVLLEQPLPSDANKCEFCGEQLLTIRFAGHRDKCLALHYDRNQ